MSVNSITTVWCNGVPDGIDCHEWISGDTAKQARALAKGDGWLTGAFDPLTGRRTLDLCPRCREERRAYL